MNLGAATSGVQGQLTAMGAGLSLVPGRIMSNWPSMVAFAITDYIYGMVVTAVPIPVGGTVGMGVRNVLRGARDTVKMITWESTKMG